MNLKQFFPSKAKYAKWSKEKQTKFDIKRQNFTDKFLCFPQGKVVFVVGDSGTGKTTLISQFMNEEKYPWYSGPDVLSLVATHYTNCHKKIWNLFKTSFPLCVRKSKKDLNRNILEEEHGKRHLVIIDDMDYAGKQTISNMTYLCNVSASKHNCLVFLIVHNPFQNGFNQIRNNCRTLILFPNKNKRQTNTFLHQYTNDSEEIKYLTNHLYNSTNSVCGWVNAIIIIFDTSGNGHYFNTLGNKIL